MTSGADAANPVTPDAAAAFRRRLRWGVYTLLIGLAVGQATGRLMAVNSVNLESVERYRINERVRGYQRELELQGLSEEEIASRVSAKREELDEQLRLQRPFLSANDRSRWMAVRALVEHGAFAIDDIVGQPTWDTIDMVQHKDRDGQLHLYSSKPPLLYVLVAGEYWLIHRVTGATLGTHPHAIGRVMLMTINILPMALMLAIVAALAERFGRTDWGRVFVVACASFGTMLSAFAVVLNNHLVAAVSASVALYAYTRIRHDGDLRGRWFLLAGLAAAFTAANELPALSFLALMGLMLAVRHPKRTTLGFLTAALLVAAAFFATNWLAHESLRPPYMHRNAAAVGASANGNDDWYRYEYTVNGKTRQSYWTDRQGIDVGETSKRTYALHCLVGHHGILSMTPIWALSALGALAWLLAGDPPRRELALMAIVLTAVCLVFYIGLRPQPDRNYGGMTNGLRWMFWFAPLWLTVMPPAVDWLSRARVGQALAIALLAASAFSASYPTWNPWTQPWIWNWLEWGGVAL